MLYIPPLVSLNGVTLKVQGTDVVHTSFVPTSASFEMTLLVVDDITVDAWGKLS